MKQMSAWFIGGFFIVAAMALVWNASARQIAKACEKVGAFFVGDVVFECKARTVTGGSK